MADQEFRDTNSLAERFEAQRSQLRSVAYRMLGSMAEADDAVQEAWIRLNRTDTSDVHNLGGWLTTVVSRVSLDMLRARASRREDELDEVRLPDPVITALDGVDDAGPEHQAVLADSVGLALLVLLDTLPPAERLAFVLHDMFALPFDEIAPIVDRTPEATRQLASRARRRVQGSPAGRAGDRARQREVVEAFLAASRGGDFEALVAVLDPDVVLRADRGPGQFHVVRGAEAVARQASTFRNVAAHVRLALVNGAPGTVATVDGEPFSVLAFTVVDGRVVEIDILSDRDRLNQLDYTALD